MKQLILTSVSLLLVYLVAAKEDPATIIVLRGDKGEIKKDTSITNADNKYYADPTNLSYDPATCHYQNIVSLKINEESPVYIPVNFKVSIPLTIIFTDNAEKTISFDTTLTVTYRKDADSLYIARSFLVREGYRKVVVKIKENPTKDVAWDVSKVLVIENEMRVTRDYLFKSNKIIENLTAGFPKWRGIDQIDELLVSWNDPNCGQTEYDLEWAWVDSSALAGYKDGGGNFSDRIIFSNNASRVTINANTAFYRLPLLYDGGGRLFYRVRPVQMKQDGTRIEGSWTRIVNGTTLRALAFIGHQNNLNWQVNTTYTEEGKRKTVIQYFDGTLRSRQTVTKDHSIDTATTVVAETLYDYQGRTSIQVLPAPTLNTIISYSKKFNQGINASGITVEYTKDLYDRLTGADTVCAKPAVGMSPASGASQYYSVNNPTKSKGINAYIPDANKYPFTEIRYTPDGTGRIAAQSGVGIHHQLGSGHETKYYYGQADQEDLDPLFGTDAGYASHYFKNMVRDANGQYSVSYVDMHGRIIATALAGKSPTNLDTLPSQIPRTNITKNLLDKETNLVKGRSVEAIKELLVPVNGAYRFSYKLSPETLKLIDKNKQDICYSCMYDLAITINDDCNNCSLPNKSPLVITRSNFSLAKLDSVCGNLPGALIIDTTINLQEGNYTIRKTLTLSSDAQDSYRMGLYTRRNTIKTFEDIKKEMLVLVKSTEASCVLSCADCRSKLGDYNTYRKNVISQSGLSATEAAAQESAIQTSYNQAKAGCDAICNGGTNRVTDLRRAMLLDMTPGYGQYAIPENSGQLYNIFTKGILFFKGDWYKRPVNETGTSVCYTNNNGDPSGLCSIDLGSGTPLSTMTKEAFIAAFQSNWAASLLYYHPEFPRLQLAETTLKLSYDWDQKIQQIATWSGASSFVNNIIDADPFLNLPGNALYKAQMATKVGSNFYTDATTGKQVSMWQVAWASVFCKNPTGAEACITNDKNKTPAGFVINAACAKDWDNVWGTFRQLYLFEKEKMVYAWSTAHITSPVSTTTLVSYGYTPRFIDPSNLSAYPGSLIGNVSTDLNKGKQAASDSIRQFYKDNCSANAVAWQGQLLSAFRQCNPAIDSTALAPLITQLITICVKGSDNSHPFGSASISLDSVAASGSYKNFPDAIAAFMAAKGMSYNATCNPYMLENPKPYEASPVYYDQEIWDKPDSCSCSRIATLKTEAAAKGYTTGMGKTFSDYLQQYYHTSISQGALDSLEGRCKGTLSPGCKMIDHAIYLPPVLQCNGSQPTCMSCSTMKTYKDDFNAMLKTSAPVKNPLNAADLAVNTAFEKFMNYKTGFNYTWLDYLDFSNTCSSYGIPQGNASDCATLQKLVNNYKTQLSDVYDSCKTVKWKIHNGFTKVVYIPTCMAIDSGRMRLPIAYQSSGAKKEFNFSDPTICMPDIFTVEYRIRTPKPIVGSDNVGFGLIFGEINRKEGEPLKLISIRLVPSAYSAERGLINIDGSYAAAYLNPLVDLDNWRVIKLEKLASVYKLYVDGVYVASYAHNQHNLGCLRFSIFNVNPSAELDWLKFYDEYGKVIYNEDFNSNVFFNKLDRKYQCSTNCSATFQQYFNEQRGSNYTFNQIDSIYYQNCGKRLDICGITGSSADCDKLNKAISLFTIYPDSLPPVRRIDARTGCDTAHWTSNYGEGKLQVAPLSEVINKGEFVPKFKDSLSQVSSLDFYDTLCLKGNLTLETRIKCPQKGFGYNPYNKGSPYTIGLRLCFDKALRVYFAFDQYSTRTIFHYIHGDKIEAGPIALPLNFDAYTTLKVVVTATYHKVYINDSLIGQYAHEAYGRFTGFFFEPFSSSFRADWIKIFDGNSQLLMQEDFNDCSKLAQVTRPTCETDCKEKFTVIYNRLHGTNYNYRQLDSISQRSCSKPLEVCGAPPMLCGRAEPLYTPVQATPNSPCKDAEDMAINKATEYYRYYKDSLVNVFDTAYYSKCMRAKDIESFTVTHSVYEHHYTLYYYDQAGNLVKTVPPAGVQANYNITWLQSVRAARNNNTTVVPVHTLVTQYRYNTLNEVIEQQTPDAGKSKFWYDRLGRLVISQNAKQAIAKQYSYTLYDLLGRITEVGQLPHTMAMMQTVSQDTAALNNWYKSAGAREQLTRTVYDLAYVPFTKAPSPLWQRNLRSRVSYVQLWDKATDIEHRAATYYSYDIFGNVDTLLQDINQGAMKTTGNRFKKIIYNYDLISGKVNSVAYQKGSKDQFYHRYSYDAENRLTAVYTSTDGIYYERDATYEYYKHGPLGRTVLGQLQVQGTDYAYTLQGWLKGINSTSLQTTDDMNGDGVTANKPAKDILGISLNYYGNEYKPIGGKNPFSSVTSLGKEYKPLYNGNISAMVINLPKVGDPILYNYRYDQLNRLVAQDAYTGLNTATNTWAPVRTDDYKERLSYDANGKILTYQRWGKGKQLDNARYSYYANTNRLEHVSDPLGKIGSDVGNQSDSNYRWNEIGEMTHDKDRGLNGATWAVYGKIQQQTLSDGRTVNYTYAPDGHRLSKTVSGTDGYSEYYIEDATGNTLAIYRKDNTTGNLELVENNIYGSSRLGYCSRGLDVSNLMLNKGNGTQVRGAKYYGLNDHRGNVYAEVNDKRVQVDNNADGVVDSYQAVIANAQDYSSFGSLLDSRVYGSTPRHTYNGKQLDKELGWQYYGAREYLGGEVPIFASVDPLTKKYAMLTPYQFASNSPISGVDLDGLEFYFAADGSYLGQSKKGGTQIRVATEYHTNPKDQSQLIFTKYQDIDKVEAAIASKVYSTIYKREVKNPHSPSVSASEETSGSAFAGTDFKNKHITVYFKESMSSDDGTRQKLMTDYYNAASTLNHEDDHASGLNSDGFDHFKIGVREATGRFQSKVSKYYKENLMSNMRGYLIQQVNSILGFRNKGDKESEGYYLKEYEKNLKTFNRLFGENDKSFFKILEKKTNTNKSQSNP